MVKRLQLEGIRPRKSSRGVWNTSTLGTLLRNRTYIGEAHYGASYAVVPERPLKTEGYRRIKKTSRRMRPEDEWIKISTPALIEPALFDRALRQLQENSKLARRNRKNQYLLSGKIRCICGLPRCGEGPQRGRHLYYRCSNRSYSYPEPSTCNERGINARIADTLVWEKLTDLMSSPDLLRAQAKRCLRKKHDKKKTTSAESNAIEAELMKLRAEEDRYTKAYGAGLFNLDQLKAYAAPIRARIATLERELPKSDVPVDEKSFLKPGQRLAKFQVEDFRTRVVERVGGERGVTQKAAERNGLSRLLGNPDMPLQGDAAEQHAECGEEGETGHSLAAVAPIGDHNAKPGHAAA